VEVERLGLDAVGGVAGALQPDDRVDVEQHHQVGAQPAGGPLRQPLHLVDGQLAAGALVGQRAVDVAVGEHDGAAVQGGRTTSATCCARSAA
jgi:hypothetical protein